LVHQTAGRYLQPLFSGQLDIFRSLFLVL